MRSNGYFAAERRTVAELVGSKRREGPAVVSAKPTTSVRTALSALSAHDVSQLPVLLGGECVGSLAEGELMAKVLEDMALLDAPVESVMEPPFPVVVGYLPVDRLLPLLTRRNAAVLVRRGDEIEGIVTRYDLIRTLTAVK
jgi:cystathionine beta-synthase